MSDADRDAVAAYYDEWTLKYLEFFGETIQAHRPTSESDLHEYLMRRSGLRDGKRVLDAGCGVCGPSIYFAEHMDVTIEAITLSPVQVRLAGERAAAKGVSGRVHVQVGDFHQLETLFPREHFDVVYFLESLSHSPDPARALAGAFAVLKPGGILYIKDYFIRPCASDEEQRKVLQVVEKVDRLFVTRTTFSERIIAELRSAGFLPVRIERPQFTVDNSVWQAFECTHQFDLFDGADSFDWSEWLELKFQKP